MVTKKTLLKAFAIILAICLPVMSLAEPTYKPPTTAGTSVYYTYWKLDYQDGANVSIGQFAMPVMGYVPIATNTDAQFYIGNSANTLKINTTDVSTSGLSDARIKLSRSFFNNVLLLSGGISLPTGKTELDFDGRAILELLSKNYLDFPVRRFGEGLGFSMQAAVAGQSETMEFGASIAYNIYGEYDPYDSVTAYNPGDALNLNGAVTFLAGRQAITASLGFASFAKDQLDGTDIFGQGSYVNFGLGATFTNGAGDIRVRPYIGYVARGKNTIFEASGAQTVESELKIYGDEFTAMLNLDSDVSERFTAGPMLIYRWIGENDDSFGPSNLLGVGGSAVAGLGESVNLTMGVTYYSGSADDGEIDLTGVQGTLGLNAAF